MWSTIIDDYVTKWLNKEEKRKIWYEDKIDEVKKQVDVWMEEIDKEI